MPSSPRDSGKTVVCSEREPFANTHSPSISSSLFLRAISVLLGEAWKGLPQPDRDGYSHKAKVMADEQKKLFPDCWKRKRTINHSAAAIKKEAAASAAAANGLSAMHASQAHPPPLTRPPPQQQQVTTARSPITGTPAHIMANLAAAAAAATAVAAHHAAAST
jgi:hypothetical protein